MVKKRLIEIIHGSGRLIYHIAVVGLSAAFVLSLPFTVSFAAKKFLAYWSLIGNDKIFLISVEMALTILFILLSHYIHKSWKNRKLSNMARAAGLVFVGSTRGLFSRRTIKKFKEQEGFARDVMVIGSTGFRTFVDPKGDLHNVMKHCREAKIMFLNPYSDGANARARSILDPDITLETFREQIKKSIDFLKGLKAIQKKVRLKLYRNIPLFKLVIIGDYIWIQHYHAGLDVRMLPEYVFKHDKNTGSLYIPFYHYFLTKWNDPEIPEYDLETDELVYRDVAGNEVRREKFEEMEKKPMPSADPSNHLVEGNTLSLMGHHRKGAHVEDGLLEAGQTLRKGLHPGGEAFFPARLKSLIPDTACWKTIL